jgi:hypothetical protein
VTPLQYMQRRRKHRFDEAVTTLVDDPDAC